jgi:hypothetical protein
MCRCSATSVPFEDGRAAQNPQGGVQHARQPTLWLARLNLSSARRPSHAHRTNFSSNLSHRRHFPPKFFFLFGRNKLFILLFFENTFWECCPISREWRLMSFPGEGARDHRGEGMSQRVQS